MKYEGVKKCKIIEVLFSKKMAFKGRCLRVDLYLNFWVSG